MGRFHVEFKLIFYVSRYEEPRFADIFVDLEDLMLFVLGFFKVRISNCIFLEIESLFVEIDELDYFDNLLLEN